MQANPRTVTALFEQTQRYVVPIFQRHYVWSRGEQWEPLWNDIEEKLDAKQRRGTRISPHFLGAVILDSARRTSTKQVSRFIVIDGQQRLTTFQLLLAALRDIATTQNLPHIARAAERCLLNPDIELMENPEEEKYKLWPTLVNRSTFCQIISAGSPEKVLELFPVIYGSTPTGRKKRKPEPRERLVEAYEFFVDKINQACTTPDLPDSADNLLLELLSVLRDDFTIVEIILGENDNSQEIFNSLNAHGKPLSQSDLLRSYIFMRAEKADADRDQLYERYWSRFEDTWWDFETRRANQNSSRLDMLTRTLLSSKVGIPIHARRVHAEYTEWIETTQPYGSLEDELKTFFAYGVCFEQLNNKSDGPLCTFGHRMGIWETTTVFPLAIYLAVESELEEQALLASLNVIESFIVRRAICGLQTKEYNKFFIEVVARLRKTGPSLQALKNILSSGEGETRRFPKDSEFGAAWKRNPVYNNRLKSAQLASTLLQLEAAIRSERAEAMPIPNVSNVSIEHVMPQQWTDNYPLDGKYVPREMNTDRYYKPIPEEKENYERLRPLILQRRELVQSFGNLTAVTQQLNAAMRNASFPEKKQYFCESVLALNRYFEKRTEWNEQMIEERADILFQHARKLWEGPLERLS